MGHKVKKSIAIIGEGISEWYYFDHIKKELSSSVKIRPDLPMNKKSNYKNIFRKAKSLNRDYDEVYCLIDYDYIIEQNQITQFTRARAELNSSIKVLITMPCTEYWFFLHFQKHLSTREYANYNELKSELRKHINSYEKSADYFRKSQFFKILESTGSRSRAIEHARALDSMFESSRKGASFPRAQIYKIFDYINNQNHDT